MFGLGYYDLDPYRYLRESDERFKESRVSQAKWKATFAEMQAAERARIAALPITKHRAMRTRMRAQRRVF